MYAFCAIGPALGIHSAEDEGQETSVQGWKTEAFFIPEDLASSWRWKQGSLHQECLVAVCLDEVHDI